MNLISPDFEALITERDAIPLSWAGSTTKMDYLNFGDALSPVMVALCSGRNIQRVPSRSQTPRMAAVGTIGHGLSGGDVQVWGTGCSPYANPQAPAAERIPYTPPQDTNLVVSATRGPVSWQLLTQEKPAQDATFGDPVWMLPRFYPNTVPKRWDIGVILHLSELADRDLEAHPLPNYIRYVVPEDERSSVRLINTVTAISAAGLRDKLDEILACRRIVSTSLHGMVIAESYGIPCLYFPPHGSAPGLGRVEPTVSSGLDLRIVDLYQGLGVTSLPVYVQDRKSPTDWSALARAIDISWSPVTLDEDALLRALPVPANPIQARPDETIFEHPLIASLKFQHDVSELNRQDRISFRQFQKSVRPNQAVDCSAPSFQIAADAPVHSSPGLQAVVDETGGVPLSWAMPTAPHPYPNLGDALSAVMVGTMAGQPIIPRHFDAVQERLAAVGTIAHGLRNGRVHLWGVGLDGSRFHELPPNTEFVVHATRGPHTAALLREKGIFVPDVYGDPVWFLPKLLPRKPVSPRWELGVIVHISELNGSSPESLVKETYLRYAIPEEFQNSIKIINTFTDRSTEGLMNRIDEILSCRRIASTSFHGLLIADTYDIPGVWFGTQGTGPVIIDASDPQALMDHRFRDFYCGCRTTSRPVYRTERHAPTDWNALIKWIDTAWTPVEFDSAPLFDSFPLAHAVSMQDKVWKIDYRTLTSLVPGAA
ncbi:polysaccharide pyruvyl transferase family protein [Gluconacetobacter tumulisoli]|uniref:Polysaccharide pyruvyl transferase family protein n=1 Tax=Gluconacetobacter tumulisoli TaxID=1286189 RepID=A0A7W4PNR3_9PROT|nr:polysaccharide pyruvyl transferase family protein [Gluconacetobacter tumulisoli]MBB2201131.1 polysaccharide pyruvyl transferase family protein [Gluconacetobacter tumulisoli]